MGGDRIDLSWTRKGAGWIEQLICPPPSHFLVDPATPTLASDVTPSLDKQSSSRPLGLAFLILALLIGLGYRSGVVAGTLSVPGSWCEQKVSCSPQDRLEHAVGGTQTRRHRGPCARE